MFDGTTWHKKRWPNWFNRNSPGINILGSGHGTSWLHPPLKIDYGLPRTFWAKVTGQGKQIGLKRPMGSHSRGNSGRLKPFHSIMEVIGFQQFVDFHIKAICNFFKSEQARICFDTQFVKLENFGANPATLCRLFLSPTALLAKIFQSQAENFRRGIKHPSILLIISLTKNYP